MKTKKKPKVVPAANVARVSMTVVGAWNKMPRKPLIDRHQMAGFYQMSINRLFKDYENFISEVVSSLPQIEIPLYIVMDLPNFVKKILEDRLKKNISSNGDDSAGSK